jgi:hypothetical protein
MFSVHTLLNAMTQTRGVGSARMGARPEFTVYLVYLKYLKQSTIVILL